MNMIDATTRLTVIFVLVDDWYRQSPLSQVLAHHPGRQASFSNSEILTLLIALDYFPYPGEAQFLGFIRANHLELFPRLLEQSQFNRRARRLEAVIEELRRFWVKQLGGVFEQHLLLDTKPLPVVGYKRRKSHSDFAGSADYGWCASRGMSYFGYKLVLLSTWEGLPIGYTLVPANTDEREAAAEVLGYARGCTIWADQGFIGTDWQAEIYRQTGNRILTAQRTNQQRQNPPGFERFLNQIRERIEGVFHEIQNTGRNLERLLRKTVEGLCTHVAAKMASHTLRLLLRHRFGIDVLTFQEQSV